MPPTTSTISKYGIALVATALALLIRVALTPWLGATFPLATMFSAVAFTVWYGGWGPALLTSVAGWVAGIFVFRGGQGFFGPDFGFNEAVGLAIYLVSNGSIILLGEAMRSSQLRLEDQRERRQLHRRVHRLRVAAERDPPGDQRGPSAVGSS